MGYQGGEVLDTMYPVTREDGSYRVPALAEGQYAVLVMSTNRVGSAQVPAGGVETVDVDVAVKPVMPPIPKLPGQGCGSGPAAAGRAAGRVRVKSNE